MVNTIAGFVSQAPNDNAWKVLVALSNSLYPGHVARTPDLEVAQGGTSLKTSTMAFNVRFVYNIQPHLVTKLVEKFVVGVMRAANGVEVVLLHELNVLDHGITPYNMSGSAVMLVTVCPTNRDRLSIDKQPTLPDFDRAETDPESDSL